MASGAENVKRSAWSS